jgi:hypothetical protein
MIQISAFADEIAADPREQVAILQAEHIRWIDLRSAWNVNVLDLSDQQVAALQQILHEAGIGVAAIASPLGKVSVDSPADVQRTRLVRAIELAQAFGTRYIRLYA